ncbi:hypothetical protein BLNAU_11431 [Blattamonas nauphoetae]|uniref:Uncharacterized protein n=1 Tax=Blattamonas nauphoetae TaxID=2049346 RepID=A0ABQ9XQA5_9EUKA|nr:hypothetical protein BLNAU_11431 [Blattamonas nauphoetae]
MIVILLIGQLLSKQFHAPNDEMLLRGISISRDEDETKCSIHMTLENGKAGTYNLAFKMGSLLHEISKEFSSVSTTIFSASASLGSSADIPYDTNLTLIKVDFIEKSTTENVPLSRSFIIPTPNKGSLLKCTPTLEQKSNVHYMTCTGKNLVQNNVYRIRYSTTETLVPVVFQDVTITEKNKLFSQVPVNTGTDYDFKRGNMYYLDEITLNSHALYNAVEMTGFIAGSFSRLVPILSVVTVIICMI